jgi:hypothetical protein
MKGAKYFIVLFCNKKKVKMLYKCNKRATVYEYWREFRTQKKPIYTRNIGGRKKEELHYELALIFPKTRWSTKVYVKDSLGRNVEAILNDKENLRIKEMIPYWEEETIYDFETKKRIRYHELIDKLLPVQEIAQLFTLNNKIFLQIEDDVKVFGNRNLSDTERLFELVKNDLIRKKKGNFLFIRDISTHQRKLLYDLLVSKGFKRRELFRHYSY